MTLTTELGLSVPVFVFERVDWDHFLGSLEWGRAETVEMTDGYGTRGNSRGCQGE